MGGHGGPTIVWTLSLPVQGPPQEAADARRSVGRLSSRAELQPAGCRFWAA